MGNNLILSIIIPTYNAEKSIGKCIGHIVSSISRMDIELLLVDDGSSDNSGRIIDEYAAKDRRIRAIHKRNGGVSSARNAGLEQAFGEWVAFCDADDFVMEDFFPLAHKTEYDFVVGSFYWNDDPCILIEDDGRGDSLKSCLSRNIHHMHLGTVWGKLYKRDIIERHGLRFDTQLDSGEDTLFVYSYISYIDSVLFSEKMVYQYNRGVESGLSAVCHVDWRKEHLLLEKLRNAYQRLEERHGLSFQQIICTDCMNRLNKCIPMLWNLPIRKIHAFLKEVTADNLLCPLWKDNCFLLKGERRKLFDIFAQRRYNWLLSLYIKCSKCKY